MIPELLAPAGGMAQLKAALHFGADAVYVGLQRFGLRAFAGNFTPEELREAAVLLHQAGKKLYVTMNIFPNDDEMADFIQTARIVQDAGADAAIVSDLGALLALRREVPGLKLHVSTQANTVNTEAAMFYDSLGCERVILAREMTLEQIRAMAVKKPARLQLEMFVHGASCMAYSGRCMLSAELTGRSANKGACAQPCRWQYHVVEEKRPGEYLPVCEDNRGTYIFSAQDLNLMSYLPQLCESGVASLKIEGRMKTEYYVGTVVSAYRQALDAVADNTFEEKKDALLAELNNASHRDSNTGFLFGRPADCGGVEGFHQCSEYLARVEKGAEANGTTLLVLKNRFYAGDNVTLLTPDGPVTFTAPSFTLTDSGETVNTYGVAGTKISMILPFTTQEGDLLRGPARNHVQ